MSLDQLLTGDVVTVTTYRGEGAYGPTYRDPVDVDCRAVTDRKLVRNAAGDEVVSESTLYVRPVLTDGAVAAEVFAPESLVTVNGRQAQVISAAPHRGTGPTVLVEVATT